MVFKSLQDSISSIIVMPSSEEGEEIEPNTAQLLMDADTRLDYPRRTDLIQSWQKRLSIGEKDLEAIVDQESSFRDLQRQLRKKGAVTNTYLQQSVHNYVYHMKHKKRRSTSSSIAS